MPFDADIGFNTDPQYQQKPFIEAAGSEFVPDLHHISENVVLLSDGSLLAMLRFPGFPFELESMRTRNSRRRQINDLIRGLADDNVTLSFHLCHHKHVTPFKWGRFHSRFSKRLFEKFERNCLSGLITNDWFITVVVSPRFTPLRMVRRWMNVFRGPGAVNADTKLVRQIGGIMQSITAYFRNAGGRQLGYRIDPRCGKCSEIAEARRLIIMGRWQPVPLTTGMLSSAIYTERVTSGTVANRISGLDGPRYVKSVMLRDYPAEEIFTGQFSHFIKVKAGEQHTFVLAQTFRILSREGARTRLYLKLTRMANAFDVQRKGMEKVEDAREQVTSGEIVRGVHNFVYNAFAPDIDALHQAATTAGSAINNAGCVPIAEDGGAFSAFWSTLPGNMDWLEGRSGGISSRDLTAFAALDGFPTGSDKGHWGRAIMRFANSGGAAWDFVTHVGDIGHAVFIGRSTSGKTLTVVLLMCALEQSCTQEDRIFYFDKDQGAEPAIRATGGAYLTLKAGQASGMAPLRGFTDTPENRSALAQLITALMTSDGRGPLKNRTSTMLHRAIARQMRLPPQERSMGAVRAFLGYGEDSDGERLDRWCAGGADGWLFDNEEDLIRTDARVVGFDMTQLFSHAACAHVAFYLMARIREVIDGRRVTVICDEVRFYLTNAFAEYIIDFSLTLRKKNGQIWLLGQEVSHIINTDLGSALVNQAQTKWLFPATGADAEEYKRIGCTLPAFKAITETMPTLGYRCVLVLREEGSVILKTELTDMDDEIAVLSGREENVRLIPGILAKVGNDPDAFTDEFIHRVKQRRQIRELT